MLLHAPEEQSEERSVELLLRKATARLRGLTSRPAPEMHTSSSGEAGKTTTPEGVPLVLPFDTERRLIPRLLHGLRRKRFLRHCPGSLDEYAPLTLDATGYFLERLHTARIDAWKECVASLWALGRLTADDPARTEAADLLYWLVGTKVWIDGKRMEKRTRAIYRNLFFVLTLGGEAAVLSMSAGPETPRFGMFLSMPFYAAIAAFPLSIPVTLLAFLAGIPLDIRRMSRIRAMAILTLGRWRDPRHLGLLLREYLGKRGRVRHAAEVALREVLPLLTAERDEERPTDFVPNLCRALQRKERQVLDYTPQEEALELLLLEALGKVGDGRALPTVERIALRGRTPRLRELAHTLLPALYLRQREANDPRQLLRGAVRPDTAPETLLRPTRETPTTPDHLLRPQTTVSDPGPIQVRKPVS